MTQLGNGSTRSNVEAFLFRASREKPMKLANEKARGWPEFDNPEEVWAEVTEEPSRMFSCQSSMVKYSTLWILSTLVTDPSTPILGFGLHSASRRRLNATPVGECWSISPSADKAPLLLLNASTTLETCRRIVWQMQSAVIF